MKHKERQIKLIADTTWSHFLCRYTTHAPDMCLKGFVRKGLNGIRRHPFRDKIGHLGCHMKFIAAIYKELVGPEHIYRLFIIYTWLIPMGITGRKATKFSRPFRFRLSV